jgi:hypothetical protein
MIGLTTDHTPHARDVIVDTWSLGSTIPVSAETIDECIRRLESSMRRLRCGLARADFDARLGYFGADTLMMSMESGTEHGTNLSISAPPGSWRTEPLPKGHDDAIRIIEDAIVLLSNAPRPDGSGRRIEEIVPTEAERCVIGCGWAMIDDHGAGMPQFSHPTPWSRATLRDTRSNEPYDRDDHEPECPVLSLLRPAVVLMPSTIGLQMRAHQVHVNPVNADPVDRIRDTAAWHAWRSAHDGGSVPDLKA